LSKTEAGWLVGIFFAAYVVIVPVLVSLTDRIPLFADGFWSALLLRMLAGNRLGRDLHAGPQGDHRPLEGTAQSRAVSWHAGGVGISGAASFAIAGAIAGLADLGRLGQVAQAK
jgi:hypothetical protein